MGIHPCFLSMCITSTHLLKISLCEPQTHTQTQASFSSHLISVLIDYVVIIALQGFNLASVRIAGSVLGRYEFSSELVFYIV